VPLTWIEGPSKVFVALRAVNSGRKNIGEQTLVYCSWLGLVGSPDVLPG